MKHKLYNPIFTLIAICFLGTTFAQKFDKKFTENFKVSKDVEIAIDASNTEINVATWNKNEVQVEAFIEIEGLSKEEAQKYFKNWNFEALGNKSKVKITSQGNNSLGLRNDFIIFNDSDFEFDFSDIKSLDLDSLHLNIDEINFPDINIDSILNVDAFDIEKSFKNGELSKFKWKEGKHNVVVTSKEEWNEFKKTDAYKVYIKLNKEAKVKMFYYRESEIEIKHDAANHKRSLVEAQAELKRELKKHQIERRKNIIDSKRELERAKLVFKNFDKEKIKRELVIAKKHIMEMKMNHNSNSSDFTINGKKIKIKKRLEIKVPKNATFNLNTRHCKVKLPNTKAFGKVSYGGFDASNLNGGRLTIDYSKVSINDLNGCTLFLNNVTDANIASVTNTTLSNNSSGLNINIINENVNLSDKFGELTIHNFNPNFNNFVLNLSNSDASILLGDVKTSFIYNINTSKLDNKTSFGAINKVIKTNEISTTSNISNENTKNKFELNAEYSTIIIK